MQTRAVATQPVLPPHLDRGVRRRLTALWPLLALVLVAGTAVAGAARQDGTFAAIAADPRGDPLAGVAPGASGHAPGASGGPAGGTIASQPAPRVYRFPAMAYGLTVRTSTEVQSARAAGRLRGEAVAVAGFMRSDPLPLSCGLIAVSLERSFCRRLAAIFPLATPVGTVSPRADPAGQTAPPDDGGLLGTIILPGVDVPRVVIDTTDLAPWITGTVPVIVIAHYEDARAPACPGSQGWCQDSLIVEQVAWISDQWATLTEVRDPTVAASSSPATGGAVGPAFGPARERASARDEQLLSIDLLSPRAVRQVDPVVAAVLGERLTGPVWYTRSLGRASLSRGAEIVWAAFDAQTGELLAVSPS